ncbi:MAG: hypothetical protein CL840_15350 [Crocinitomicaceae bacterium]|jgi:hypothetical protein|nr:hypothetical protein [Crocinitomicaceae bacterium]|tara:strand:+ start:331 stop:636 length:306 start_codon:yes stop_codon:yes gene_type:complete
MSIRLPFDEARSGAKRIYPAPNHWLEITCPECSEITCMENHDVIFHYGLKHRVFWCEHCEIETPGLIHKATEDDILVIEKHPEFAGKIEHKCFTPKSVSKI